MSPLFVLMFLVTAVENAYFDQTHSGTYQRIIVSNLNSGSWTNVSYRNPFEFHQGDSPLKRVFENLSKRKHPHGRQELWLTIDGHRNSSFVPDLSVQLIKIERKCCKGAEDLEHLAAKPKDSIIDKMVLSMVAPDLEHDSIKDCNPFQCNSIKARSSMVYHVRITAKHNHPGKYAMYRLYRIDNAHIKLTIFGNNNESLSEKVNVLTKTGPLALLVDPNGRARILEDIDSLRFLVKCKIPKLSHEYCTLTPEFLSFNKVKAGRLHSSDPIKIDFHNVGDVWDRSAPYPARLLQNDTVIQLLQKKDDPLEYTGGVDLEFIYAGLKIGSIKNSITETCVVNQSQIQVTNGDNYNAVVSVSGFFKIKHLSPKDYELQCAKDPKCNLQNLWAREFDLYCDRNLVDTKFKIVNGSTLKFGVVFHGTITKKCRIQCAEGFSESFDIQAQNLDHQDLESFPSCDIASLFERGSWSHTFHFCIPMDISLIMTRLDKSAIELVEPLVHKAGGIQMFIVFNWSLVVVITVCIIKNLDDVTIMTLIIATSANSIYMMVSVYILPNLVFIGPIVSICLFMIILTFNKFFIGLWE